VNRQLTTALAIATSAIVGAAVIGGVGAATASQSSPSPTTQALAKLEQAKKLINEAEGLLTPTTTPKPTPTTTPPPTPTPSGTPTPPPPGSSAGGTQNWGIPLAQFSDEFNTAGGVDASKWYNSAVNCMDGNAGNGKRCPQDAVVDPGGFLRETGEANGNTGWVASKLNQKYGKWEMRMRLSAPVGNGHPYHPVLLLWPESEKWPQGGEYDYAETDIGDHGVEAFIHHPADTVVQDHYSSPQLDLAQWHTYAIAWTPTAITGYIDGVQWFSDTNSNAQAPGGMHATIQLDNSNGGDMMPATMDVDWFHVWA
jgi:hypothetical protein